MDFVMVVWNVCIIKENSMSKCWKQTNQITKEFMIKCSMKILCGVYIATKSCKKDFESFNTILTGFTISYVQDLFRTNFFEGL